MAAKDAGNDAPTIDALSDEFYQARKRELKKRLKKRRYQHVKGVASTAKELARTYNVSVRKAHLAGLLHDWDKNYTNDEIRIRARSLGLEKRMGTYVIDNMPYVLHGPTAAKALGKQFPEIPADVLQAIDRHTTGAAHMSDLDMVIYIADALEPQRDFEGVEELRLAVGKKSLEELFLMTYKQLFVMLLESERNMYPDNVKIWNYYIARAHDAADEKGAV